jgi:hypothetical protein
MHGYLRRIQKARHGISKHQDKRDFWALRRSACMPIHRRSKRPYTHGVFVEMVSKSIPEVWLSDCLSAVTIQRRVHHELLVDGLGDEQDPSQNDFLQLSRNI